MKRIVNNYYIVALTEFECNHYKKPFPCFVCWKYYEDVGKLDLTENETDTYEEMKEWCKSH